MDACQRGARSLGRWGGLLILLTVSVSLVLGAGRPKEGLMAHFSQALKCHLDGDLLQSEACLRGSIRTPPVACGGIGSWPRC